MYMVTTTWRHDKPIDKENMRKTLSGLKNRNNSSEVIDVMWFEIDEVTHGSVLIYSSKEACDKDMQERNKWYNDLKVKLKQWEVHELPILIFADLRNEKQVTSESPAT